MMTKLFSSPDAQPLSNNTSNSLPAEFLNAYEILNATDLKWDVALYEVRPTSGRVPSHEKRGDIKQVLWKLLSKYKDHCRGYGFILDVEKTTVAIPAAWEIPSPLQIDGYTVTRQRNITVCPGEARYRSIATGLIREGLKKHFKDNRSSQELGNLWQDFNAFCQSPTETEYENWNFCRKFRPSIKILRGNRYAVECIVSTVTVDSHSFSEYYQAGKVAELARMIAIKQFDRLDRTSSLRVLRYNNSHSCPIIEALELDDVDVVISHSHLTAEQQTTLSTTSLRCHPYKKSPQKIPSHELHLILASGVTAGDHAETIINPSERVALMRRMRGFINEVDIYGQKLLLAEAPFNTAELPGDFILPPANRVLDKDGSQTIIPAPEADSKEILKERTKIRSQHIAKYGFLEQRPINPLLAFYSKSSKASEERMRNDLNRILRNKGIRFQFKSCRFDTVDDIRHKIEHGNHDALLAVLPDTNEEGQTNVHDQIKQRIEVPSQCIRNSNTLDRRLVEIPYQDFPERKRRYGRRVQQTYHLCISNLLVKHNWIPFAPAEAFNFNVQIGIDVGGVHNTDAVSCFGYGFQNPLEGLIFRPDEIPIETRKAEPIPTKSLYEGLLRQFELFSSELKQTGKIPDFETVLFFRDGQLLGEGNSWNEKDAIENLHSELLRRQWITPSSTWTVVEVMKTASDWRLFEGGGSVQNPLAGRYLFPFDDNARALVCTTGSQHLTQGTACPLLIHIVDIHGTMDRRKVIQDLVWQADMCFTKPDVGLSLPWVLHVADAGALQQSRSYKITGITA